MHTVRRLPLVAALFCTNLAFAFPQQASAQDAEPLFNGKDLSGWRGRPHLNPSEEAGWSSEQLAAKQAEWARSVAAHWRVQDGELINDGHGVFLTTTRDYGDMELWLEYKTVPLADSGIYLRATPQVQIWDTRQEGGKWELGADKGSGGLWNNQTHARFPLVLADRPFGEWNQFRIQQLGARTTVEMNGKLVVDHVVMENFWDRKSALPARGPVQLQTHGGEIRFRNLRIREIPPEEANRKLAAVGDEGFRSLFDGESFAGWSGAVDQYEIVDGAIQCRAGQGGNLFTQEEFEDFAVRLEFRLPPGGNNGLAIRFPGEGNPAYDGLCELQVLDNSAEKYAQLKEWQFHGSAYGMVAAQRGYQRPVGEWNFQEVTVQGARIRVELNGSIILDTDLAEVELPEGGPAHPGLNRRRGHFGFAGHGDPVAFRNIRIKPLD